MSCDGFAPPWTGLRPANVLGTLRIAWAGAGLAALAARGA
jgi:hypothetical protein